MRSEYFQLLQHAHFSSSVCISLTEYVKSGRNYTQLLAVSYFGVADTTTNFYLKQTMTVDKSLNVIHYLTHNTILIYVFKLGRHWDTVTLILYSRCVTYSIKHWSCSYSLCGNCVVLPCNTKWLITNLIHYTWIISWICWPACKTHLFRHLLQ